MDDGLNNREEPSSSAILARKLRDAVPRPVVSTSLALMGDGDEEPDEEPSDRPATWENRFVGEVKEFAGRVFGNEELAEEGEEQEEIADEVSEEYKHKHREH